MSVYSLFKKKQNRKLSKTWRELQTTREIEKNNFLVNGNLKEAKTFSRMVSEYKTPLVEQIPTVEPITIYSAI